MKRPLPSRHARSAITLVAALAAAPFLGCNTLLDNTPGQLGGEVASTEPTEPGADGGGAERDAEASTPSQTPHPDDGPRAGSACLVGTKPCAGACVKTEDPTYGCGGPTCEACTAAHAVSACASGACTIAKCEPGWGDCNALASDGCETDLSAIASCGACGVACATTAPRAMSACVAFACTTQCQPGFGDCNANPADGCEKDLLADKHNCGVCGRVCLVGRCEAGSCVLKL